MNETLYWLRIPFVVLILAFALYSAWGSLRRPE